ncbi:hypothetical protein DESC_610350 [Desulfosarcina cetonica]|nr:hypothetical protein DESC_610350 [Desulfosarcina cetonica]
MDEANRKGAWGEFTKHITLWKVDRYLTML